MSSESAERAYPMHILRTNPRLRFFPPIYIGSLTSAPFCITVHRPGRLPIMSLYSYKDKSLVYTVRVLDLDKSFLNFLEATRNQSLYDTLRSEKKYIDSCLGLMRSQPSHEEHRQGMRDIELHKFRSSFEGEAQVLRIRQ